MPKTLVAHEQAVSQIFSDNYVFHIPGYQRPYAWTNEQARELFDDLNGFMQANSGSIDEMPPYFLGSIVLIKDEAKPDAEVVDGQQRLTTLTILLSAIRASVTGKFREDITPLLYEKGNLIKGTPDRDRLTLRERDREFFQKYIQRDGGIEILVSLQDELQDSQNNIRSNTKLYLNLLKDIPENERVDLATFIVKRCYLVVVATPDLDSAYRIFSVLNSRGLDLTPTDILKAEILGAITDKQRDDYTKKWEEAEETVGREAFSDLFSHIRMIYRKAKPHGTLVKEFKEHVIEVRQPVIFIDNVLLPIVNAFDDIRDASYESTEHAEKINEYFRWLNRLDFTDWVPPAIAYLVRHRQEPNKLHVFFRDLERLAYSLWIMRTNINDRINRFSRLTSAIENDEDLRMNQAMQLTPNEQYDVYTQLNGEIYMDLPKARLPILLRLDALLSGGGASYDFSIISIEHVMPQTPSENSQWLTWFTDNEHMKWVHRLGNLVLLTRRKNSSASNYDFATKKTSYFQKGGISPFALTTQVIECPEWTPKVVEGRQSKLINILEKHWQLQNRMARKIQIL